MSIQPKDIAIYNAGTDFKFVFSKTSDEKHFLKSIFLKGTAEFFFSDSSTFFKEH